MPELPEVEGARAHLERWLAGRRILAFDVLDPTVLKLDQGDGSALGSPDLAVTRRAKHLILRAASEAWVIHLRMTGELVQGAVPGRARWVLDDGSSVSFRDPRRFAEIRRMRVDQLSAWFAALSLGPEPWPERRDGAWWGERLRGARGPLKPVLMEQSRIAGLGNICAAEICWLARLSPFRPAGGLSEAELARLAEEAHPFLERAVAACSSERVVYVNQGGENPFSVYQRTSCPRCAGPIARLTQAGRGTWWCPNCQGERRVTAR